MFTTDGDRVDWADTQGGRYRSYLPAGYSTVLGDKFHESQLPVDVAPSPGPNLWLAVVLPNVILILTIGGFMLFMLRRQRVRGDPNRV